MESKSIQKTIIIALLSFSTTALFAKSLKKKETSAPLPIQNKIKEGISVSKVSSDKPLKSELKSLKSNSTWKVWMNATAQSSNKTTSAISKVGKYKIEKGSNTSSEESFNKESPLVVYNERTKVVGIIPGTIKIISKGKSDITNLLQDHHLKLIDSFPHLLTYYVTPESSNFNLATTFQKLSKDQRIQTVEIEILNKTYEKK